MAVLSYALAYLKLVTVLRNGAVPRCASGKATWNNRLHRPSLYDLRSTDILLSDKTICDASELSVRENGKQENDTCIIRVLSKSLSVLVVTRREP